MAAQPMDPEDLARLKLPVDAEADARWAAYERTMASVSPEALRALAGARALVRDPALQSLRHLPDDAEVIAALRGAAGQIEAARGALERIRDATYRDMYFDDIARTGKRGGRLLCEFMAQSAADALDAEGHHR